MKKTEKRTAERGREDERAGDGIALKWTKRTAEPCPNTIWAQ